MLELKELKAGYEKNIILKNINISMQAGQIYGIVGRNGAGKSTLLRCIAADLAPQGGQILWQGQPVSRQMISFLETDQFFYSRLTAGEYLQLFKTQNPDFQAEKWAAIFEVPLNKLIDNFSTGMKKKLALLAILSFDRPVVVLDEPFNGLDLSSNHLVKQVIRTLCQMGKLVLITSHILETLVQTTSRIYYLKKGEIVKTFNQESFDQISDEIFEDLMGNEQIFSDLLEKKVK